MRHVLLIDGQLPLKGSLSLCVLPYGVLGMEIRCGFCAGPSLRLL